MLRGFLFWSIGEGVGWVEGGDEAGGARSAVAFEEFEGEAGFAGAAAAGEGEDRDGGRRGEPGGDLGEDGFAAGEGDGLEVALEDFEFASGSVGERRDKGRAADHSRARARRGALGGDRRHSRRDHRRLPSPWDPGPVHNPGGPCGAFHPTLLAGPDAPLLPVLQAVGVPSEWGRPPTHLVHDPAQLHSRHRGGGVVLADGADDNELLVLPLPVHRVRPAERHAGKRQSCSATPIRHVLTPVITMLGMDLGYFLGGVLIIESVFGLPGVGQLAYNAIDTLDIPMITGTVLVAAVFMVVMNFVVDVTYTLIDPRVRLSRR